MLSQVYRVRVQRASLLSLLDWSIVVFLGNLATVVVCNMLTLAAFSSFPRSDWYVRSRPSCKVNIAICHVLGRYNVSSVHVVTVSDSVQLLCSSKVLLFETSTMLFKLAVVLCACASIIRFLG
jgi:hypothetical protein